MEWNNPERVRFFAERDPDIHLLQILEEGGEPSSLRALDLGCAAGRNTEALLRAGCDTYAVDLAPAMVAAACRRVGHLWAAGTGVGRIFRADMRALPFREATFDLVVAIGIFHEASCEEDLLVSFQETRRVLNSKGRVLVSVFGVEMLPPEARPVVGQRFHYETPDGGIHCRLSQEELIEVADKTGFVPSGLLEKRCREEKGGLRVTHLVLFKIKGKEGF